MEKSVPVQFYLHEWLWCFELIDQVSGQYLCWGVLHTGYSCRHRHTHCLRQASSPHQRLTLDRRNFSGLQPFTLNFITSIDLYSRLYGCVDVCLCQWMCVRLFDFVRPWFLNRLREAPLPEDAGVYDAIYYRIAPR